MGLLLLVGSVLALSPRPSWAALDNDRYDGNIYALYAGNGSLVPPRSTLAQSLADQRVTVLVFYLDDSAVSKRFAAVVSELQRVWGQAVELMPLVTDPLQNRPDGGATDPAHYWSGLIPEVVVLDRAGTVAYRASGQVPVGAINQAISKATGLALPADLDNRAVTESFNELNSEVVRLKP
ncbi:MAG: thylakoid membrane photosystem I accumulation factor [Synechococcaceae cyanobacterium]|nr:thylakoid membrane photosystem I accumulation factor [Synechococcaceae cyanobacterium]